MNRRPSILVVDRDHDSATSLAMLFEATFPDMVVVLATSVPDALAEAHGRNLDLVVTEYRLGDWNGFEFLDQVRAAQPRVKTILLTSSTREEMFAKGERVPVDRVMFKPLDHVGLLRSVSELCKEKREVPATVRWYRPPDWTTP